jgi:uncharacterized protein (UPF0335 family)
MPRRKMTDATRTAQEAEARKNDFEADYTKQMVALFEKRRELNGEIAELTKALTQAGLSGKVIKSVARLQMESDEEREDRETFEAARDELAKRLGGFVHTPLGQAAVGATH